MAATKKHSLADVPKYKKWVKARDRALEDLHTRAQLESSDILRKTFAHTLLIAKSHYQPMKHGDSLAADQLDNYLKQLFSEGTHSLYNIVVSLRRSAYVLAKASEAEIIAQLLPQDVTSSVTRMDIHRIQSKTSFAGGQLFHRIKYYMDKLRRKIVSQAQSSALNAPDEKSFMIDVLQAFPQHRVVMRPKRVLKPKLMEAENDDVPEDSVAVDLIDDAAWQEMLTYYKEDYVPVWRAPEYVVDMPTTNEDVWYAWEFERDLTNEFVSAVRDGQIEAAKENGITDFFWIAVVDNVTDACCLWRDGLLISEIEEQLDQHEGEDEECDVGDGLNPPIHFNCRCTLAPATDQIPEKPDTMAKEFENWLND